AAAWPPPSTTSPTPWSTRWPGARSTAASSGTAPGCGSPRVPLRGPAGLDGRLRAGPDLRRAARGRRALADPGGPVVDLAALGVGDQPGRAQPDRARV